MVSPGLSLDLPQALRGGQGTVRGQHRDLCSPEPKPVSRATRSAGSRTQSQDSAAAQGRDGSGTEPQPRSRDAGQLLAWSRTGSEGVRWPRGGLPLPFPKCGPSRRESRTGEVPVPTAADGWALTQNPGARQRQVASVLGRADWWWSCLFIQSRPRWGKKIFKKHKFFQMTETGAHRRPGGDVQDLEVPSN